MPIRNVPEASKTQTYVQQWFISVVPPLVSEPDPRKIEKEGLAHRPGWKCTLRNVRNFINCRTLQSL